MKTLVLALTVAAAAALPAPSVAAAAHIVVDSSASSAVGECTLGAAIEAANEDVEVDGCAAGSPAETDVIEFALPPASTIHIEGSPFEPIAGDTEIRGPGSGELTVDGDESFPDFYVESGGVAISGLTITGGRCEKGCGIYNEANLTLEEVLVLANQAEAPALAGNVASAEGGGIVNQGTMTITLSTLLENTAVATTGTEIDSAEGGGIKNYGTLTVDRSTLFENGTLSGDEGSPAQKAFAAGGGIANVGTLTVERSTLADNRVFAGFGTVENQAQGGAIANISAPEVEIRDSTIADDVSEAVAAEGSAAAVEATAGGVQVDASDFDVLSSTIAGNHADEGANLFLRSAPSVESTIVAEPEGGGQNCEGPVAGVLSAGFNLESEDSCGFDQPTDQVEKDPLLAPSGLAANGGPTETIALEPGSPALDQGKAAPGETTDQRGLLRPVDIASIPDPPGGDGSDVGAFELQVPIARIASGPAEGATITEPSASFGFDANEPAAGFRCSLDGAPATACASPMALSGLADGLHTFAVVAVDANGYASATPATRTFTVAVRGREEPAPPNREQPLSPPSPSPPSSATSPAPKTTIKGLAARTFSRKLKIRFLSSEPGSTFACKLDRGKYKPCTSPYRTGKLSFGKHTFRVRATNPAGVPAAAPASRTFKVLRRAKRR